MRLGISWNAPGDKLEFMGIDPHPWLVLGIAAGAAMVAWYFVRFFLLAFRLTAPKGACPECGFDMRRSGDTCPECGTVAPADSRHSLRSERFVWKNMWVVIVGAALVVVCYWWLTALG